MARPKKMKRRQRITLYVEAGQKAKLDRLAVQRHRPWAELVREALDSFLSKRKRSHTGTKQ